MNIKNAEKGLSLIEVVFSMFMLFAFVLLLSQSILQIAKNQRASTDVTQAAFLCQNKLEDIRVNRGKDITEGISSENITIGGKSSPYVYEIEKKTWGQDSNFWEFVVSVKKFFGGKIVERSFASMAYALPKEASGEGEQFFNIGSISSGGWRPVISQNTLGVRFNSSTNCIEVCNYFSADLNTTPYITVSQNWQQINPPAPKPIKRLFAYELNLSVNIGTIRFIVQDTDNNLWEAKGNFHLMGVLGYPPKSLDTHHVDFNPFALGVNPTKYHLNNRCPLYSLPYGSSSSAVDSPWQQVPGLTLR